jgi:hypothetical protein
VVAKTRSSKSPDPNLLLTLNSCAQECDTAVYGFFFFHWLGKNQTLVPQLPQQFRMLLGKELESSGFVWLNSGDIQDNRGEAANLRIVRLRHPFKVAHVLFGDVRLLKEREDVVLVLNGLALALRSGLAALAHMDFVTFAGELLVRTFAPANPAVMSHPGSF